MKRAKANTNPLTTLDGITLTAAQNYFDRMQHTHEEHPYAVIICTPSRLVVCEFVAYGADSAIVALSEWRAQFHGCTCSAVRMGSELHLMARTASRCGATSINDFLLRSQEVR